MTTDQDMLDELDQEPVIAEAWIPDNEGDTIIGVVESVTVYTGGEYDDYPVVTLVTDDGELRAVHCFGTVLAGHVADDGPAKGDRYAIRYAGERQSKNGRTYKDWRTALRKGPFIAADPTPPPKSATTRKKTDDKTTVDADGITF